ncbi:WD40 repeat-like protein [Melanomma pulvis-pyrius CBS 109.77]|uniref:Mitochondrial division protein 1 n=1 Tax=Melanomma pulvis-pyrius CBS 109.77 TaxID=1314802 RepID=A0A6A6WY11_9PLEO|nr:WD40 repeat-like protein [Melanomma pulvis-pyrius CBS 109.77]
MQWPASQADLEEKLAAVGNRFASVYLDKILPRFVREGEEWFAYFNPASFRSLDVGLVRTFQHESVITRAHFSHDGQYIAIATDHKASVFEVTTGRLRADLLHKQPDRLNSGEMYARDLVSSSDDRRLVTGAEDSIVRIWDLSSQKVIHHLIGHETDIYSVDMSGDDHLIVSGGADKTMRTWEPITGRQMLQLTTADTAACCLDHTIPVWSISASLDRTVKVWEVNYTKKPSLGAQVQGWCTKTFEGHNDFVFCTAATPDGAWKLSGALQFVLVGHAKFSVIGINVNASGTMFATASGYERSRIWRYASTS